MNEETNEPVTHEELSALEGEPLPDREQMSLIRGPEPLPAPILPDGGGGGFTIEPVPAEEA